MNQEKSHVGLPAFQKKASCDKRHGVVYSCEVKLINEVGPPIKYLIYVMVYVLKNLVWLWMRKRIT